MTYQPPKLIHTFSYAKGASALINYHAFEKFVETANKRMKIEVEYSDEEFLKRDKPNIFSAIEYKVKDHNDRVVEITEPEWNEYCKKNYSIDQAWIDEQLKITKEFSGLNPNNKSNITKAT